MSTLSVDEAARVCGDVVAQVERAVVGKPEQIRLVLAAIVAGGHVLLEDNPGLGKTLLARSFAQALGLQFKRIQFTPDLLPADVTGSYVYDQRAGEFAFRSGPLFANIVLADEINRTPPRTQAALLEAMQEAQTTVEGTTFTLPQPFHVLATANPIEYEGTYPLPEAQLDRFLVRVSLGYPDQDEELDVLERRFERRQELIELPPVTDPDGLLAVQTTAETVVIERSVSQYCVALATATRSHPEVMVGASPRGSLALALVARSYALVCGRDFVAPDDVKAVAVPALAHRLTLQPELWLRGSTTAEVVRGVLNLVQVPGAAA